MLLRGLHLRSALGSPAFRRRQEFNESSQYRECLLSLHKIISFLWDQALGMPKTKGDISRLVTTSITCCVMHKTYQPSDPQQRRCLAPCRLWNQMQRCGWLYRSFSFSSYTRQPGYCDWTQSLVLVTTPGWVSSYSPLSSAHLTHINWRGVLDESYPFSHWCFCSPNAKLHHYILWCFIWENISCDIQTPY